MRRNLLAGFLLLISANLSAQSFKWVRSGGSGKAYEYAADIANDKSGNLYVAGTLNSEANIGSASLQKGGFLAKYDSTGALIWAVNTGSKKNNGIAVDAQGYVYVTGDSSYMVGDTSCVFTAMFRPNGSRAWRRLVQGTRSSWGNKVAVNHNGKCYVAGTLSDTVIILAYDTSGNTVWVRKQWFNRGSKTWTEGRGITLDADSNIYVAGGRFYPNQDIHLYKFTPGGNLVWDKTMTGEASPASLVSDGKNLYLTGDFRLTALDFGSQKLNPVSSSQDAFIAQFDTAGNLVKAVSMGQDSEPTKASDIFADYSLSGGTRVYVTGYFEKTMVFGPDTLETKYRDGFLSELDGNLGFKWTVSPEDTTEGFAVAAMGNSIYCTGLLRNSGGSRLFAGLSLNSHPGNFFVSRLATAIPTVSVKEPGSRSSLRVFPNPAGTHVTVTATCKTKSRMNIYSVDGRLLAEKEINAGSFSEKVDISLFPEGIYLIRVWSGHEYFQQKILKSGN